MANLTGPGLPAARGRACAVCVWRSESRLWLVRGPWSGVRAGWLHACEACCDAACPPGRGSSAEWWQVGRVCRGQRGRSVGCAGVNTVMLMAHGREEKWIFAPAREALRGIARQPALCYNNMQSDQLRVNCPRYCMYVRYVCAVPALSLYSHVMI